MWGRAGPPGRRRAQGRRADLAQICAKSRAARQPVSSPRTSRAGRRGSSGAGAATGPPRCVGRRDRRGADYTCYTPLARTRARRPRGPGNRIAHTGAVGPGTVGGADLLSGPLDIAPCGAALGRRDRRGPGPRGPPGAGRAGSGARVATGPACGGEAVGGGCPSPRRADRAVAARVAIPGAAGAVGHPRDRGPGRAGRRPAAGHGLC